MNHDAHKYNDWPSIENLRIAQGLDHGVCERLVDYRKRQEDVRTDRGNKRSSWYLGRPGAQHGEAWLGYLRTAGGTALDTSLDPLVAKLDKLQLPAELDAGTDAAVLKADTDACFSTEQEEDARIYMDFADGDISHFSIMRNTCHKIREFTPDLLGLPQEVRNKIYRHVLVYGRSIPITPDFCGTPGLIRTNRQLHEETMNIWLHHNIFILHVRDCCPVAPQGFFIENKHQRHWLYQAPWLTYTWSGEHHWDNLRDWLRIYHANGIHSPHAEGSQDSRLLLPCKAFEIVERMKHAPWEMVRDVLEDWKSSTQIAQNGSGHIVWT